MMCDIFALCSEVAQDETLVNTFLGKNVIIDIGEHSLQGQLLFYKQSSRGNSELLYHDHRPEILVLRTRNGLTIVRGCQVIKTTRGRLASIE